MKKFLYILPIFLIFCMLQCNLQSYNFAAAESTPAYVRAVVKTYIYQNASLLSSKLATLEIDAKVKVVVAYTTDSSFYQIHTQDIVEGATATDVGYVQKAHTLDCSINSNKVFLQTNAKTTKDCKVYTYNETTQKYAEVSTLQNDTKIRVVEKYNSSSLYTYIAYTSENDDINYGYVHTENIDVDGISPLIYVGICTLIACFMIFIAIFGKSMLKKKRETSAKNK